MPRSAKIAGGPEGSLARELLEFYDELTELDACSAFVTQALAVAVALLKGGGWTNVQPLGRCFVLSG